MPKLKTNKLNKDEERSELWLSLQDRAFELYPKTPVYRIARILEISEYSAKRMVYNDPPEYVRNYIAISV